MDEKFEEKSIIISFNPLTREFEVGDNAKKRAAEWIYDISEVFLTNPGVSPTSPKRCRA